MVSPSAARGYDKETEGLTEWTPDQRLDTAWARIPLASFTSRMKRSGTLLFRSC